MSAFLSIFITTASQEEASTIAHMLVEERLAACATILPHAQSVYRWHGKVEQAEECAIIAKTTAEKFDELQKRVKDIHSYECPCIVATPIVAGNDAYLKWVDENT